MGEKPFKQTRDTTDKMGIPTKAYLVEEVGGPFVLKDVVLDQLEPDEVLVEMKYTGLCHTVRPPLSCFVYLNPSFNSVNVTRTWSSKKASSQ